MFTRDSIKQFLKSSWEKKEVKLWIFCLLGASVLVFSVELGSKIPVIKLLYENNKNVIFFFIFVIFFLLFFAYLIISLKDYFFRSYQMKGIANKYNLNYTNPKKPFFEISLPLDRKSNIIEGKINGKNVLMYDYVNFQAYEAGRGSVSRSATIISIDGKKKELSGFFTGFCSVKKIDSFLADLSRER